MVPEFGRITALHQNDLYHVYTVDLHSLFALRRLYALREGDLLESEPELSREMAAFEDPLPLFLAALLHDAGKGMGGGHAQRGRELAASLGERLGLSPRQREVTEFLVLHHLLLSQTAQRRDLSDPELIAQFASQVGDLERLNALYLLTYADMSSVAPGTWNEWRARLVRELYAKAKVQLLGAGPSAPFSRAAFAERWRRAFGEGAAQALLRRLPERYFLSASPSRATLDARLLRRAREDALAAFLCAVPAQGTSELSLCTRDRPGLLSQLAGVLSAHGIDILRAQIASTDDGFALDVFDVRGPGGRPLERARWRAARADLRRVAQGTATAEEVLRKRRRSALLTGRLPRVPTRVSVDNQASRRFSVVDVRAEDRVGLLYRIARAMKDAGAEIALAAIATEAHHAVDSFYVTRHGERITDPGQIAELARRIEEAISAEEPG